MIDEAFPHFHQLIERLLSFHGDIVDEERGIHSYIVTVEIESPVELDVVRDEQGTVQIGSVPPLYRVDTSIRPSFHRLRFIAERTGVSDGG